jgi:small nuclear ribonucleoprotein (snRNP)-like protein
MQLSLADVALSADATLPNPSLTRQRVDQFGVGAKVKVELVGGRKLKGSIRAIENGAFAVGAKRVAYGDVAQLKLAKITYNAKGQPDAVEAKRVATGLGVGRHIVVKTTEGMEYHGNIVAIGAESFTVLPDHTAAPVQIAYNNVQQMGPNMSTGKKVVIAVLVVIALVVVIATVYSASTGNLGHL